MKHFSKMKKKEEYRQSCCFWLHSAPANRYVDDQTFLDTWVGLKMMITKTAKLIVNKVYRFAWMALVCILWCCH